MSRSRVSVLLWLLVIALCVASALRTRFTADLSAFLPSAPTAEQALLVDLLRDGMVSRLLLVGIEGGGAEQRAQASAALADALAADERFLAVNNGRPRNADADRAWLFANRYLLSPAVDGEHFSADGLRKALSHTLDLLASSAGLLVKPLLASDPTAETLRVLETLSGQSQPARSAGVWASADGTRALLLATTRASGSDTDGQEAAITTAREAFSRIPGSQQLTLLVSGPGVFAVNARATIKGEIQRLSLTGAALIITLLLIVYRSLAALLLGLAPVVTGALVGILAVSLAFGEVHGITLGFGITLIGEAVDYAIYFFVHGAASVRTGLWRTIRLGVITSLCGFAALLLTGFPGLAQMGLYSMAGLVAAVLTTRFVLPALVPASLRVRDVSPLGRWLARPIAAMHRLRWPLLGIAALAAASLYGERGALWHHELSALSPVPMADQQLDARLRADLGAPDTRYLVIANGDSAEEALQKAELLVAPLEQLRSAGVIAGFESPSRFLPSLSTQQARRDALPEAATLRARLDTATADLPLKADRLGRFVEDVERARQSPLITREALDGTSMAIAVDAMLIRQGSQWRALLPLRSPPSGLVEARLDGDTIREVISAAALPGTVFIDLAHETQRMYASYLSEAWAASLGGIAAIVVVLLIALRSPLKVLRLALPLAVAVLLITSAVVLSGERLTLLHLVGMLLVGAVGSNYALFFVTAKDGLPQPETLASLLIANLTTLCGFGVLALSNVPVLHAMGVIVGPGAMLALACSAIFASQPRHEPR